MNTVPATPPASPDFTPEEIAYLLSFDLTAAFAAMTDPKES